MREQPRALQVKRARELEIKEKNKKHKEVGAPRLSGWGGGASVQLSSITNAQNMDNYSDEYMIILTT